MDFDLNEEHKAWKKAVHDFVGKVVKPKAREVDENEEFNWEAVRKGGPLGLMGMSIPEAYGRCGYDLLIHRHGRIGLGLWFHRAGIHRPQRTRHCTNRPVRK